ncbi:hypothetical protein Tco_1467163, partial [Tanacetum coccineum]
LGDTCPLTRITKPEVVPLEKSGSVSTSEPANNIIVTHRFSKKPLTSYKRKDRKLKDISTGSPPNTDTKAVNDPVNVVQIVLWYLDSGCSWHMTGDRSKLINYVEKFIGTVRHRMYQFCSIMDIRDYYKSILYLTKRYDGSISSLLALKSLFNKVMVMASSVKSSEFQDSKQISSKRPCVRFTYVKVRKGTLNVPSCQLGKSKKSSHPLKTVNTNTEVLPPFTWDLCGPM